MLAIIMILTLVPLYQSPVAYAADGELEEKIVKLTDEEVKKNMEKAEAELEKKLGIVDLDEEDAEEPEAEVEGKAVKDVPAKKAEKSGLKLKSLELDEVKLDDDLKLKGFDLKGLDLKGYDETGQFIYASDPDSTGNVQVDSADLTGTGLAYIALLVGDEPDDIYDESKRSEMKGVDLTGNDQIQFSKIIDMKYFDVGYHTIFVLITDGTQVAPAIVKAVPTYIYETPSNSLSNYWTYTKKFDYKYTGSTEYTHADGGYEYLDMFMDYKKSSAKSYSKYVYRMDSSYTTYTKKGLKPNTAYKVRQMLGKTFDYDGSTYTFTGRQTGHASSAKTIRTAYKKPKVKKIDISKVKQYCHKYRYQYAWRVWYRNGIEIRRKALYHTYRYWYTRYTVTVKFKKKQKVAGGCIRTIQGLYAWKSGDKKTYKQKFVCRGKKKGKKVTVKFENSRSKTYGGYSGKYSKKVRCK